MNGILAAHISEDGKIQTISEHLLGTAKTSKKFGHTFGGEDHAYLLGLLHDIGKYSDKFQRRIYQGGNSVDHSTAGAVEINKAIPQIGYLLSYCIAGHHTGLPDGGNFADVDDEPTLNSRLRRNLEPYANYKRDIDPELFSVKPLLPIHPLEKVGFSVSFYIRMLFSCLVDSDFLDTEEFMQGDKGRGPLSSIEDLYQKLDAYINLLGRPESEINKKRTEILNSCIVKADSDKGIYTLTVPTGGGKTISSLAFALKHAKRNKMDRIIYVIPYNSIIEQNAGVFKSILGEGNVLEHHSNFSYDDIDENGILSKHRLATENWDMPVVVTTTVQFFESIFANRTSRCRKLHNIANSVIIFDEAQMLPLPYLKPCVRAIAEFVKNYGSTAVLCSATQPKLGDVFPKALHINEISDNTEDLFKFFKRTKLIFTEELRDEELLLRLNGQKQVLCIVNTRKHAQRIFNLMKGEGCYHLSTLMYPHHRKRVLNEIRERLKADLTCRVVSTSLIEAGVDVDFPVVYRADAGLDSVIQAAGRCNREGKRDLSEVYIFKTSSEYRCHMPESIKRATALTNSISHQYEDISSPEAISSYFHQLYQVTGNGLDIKKIVSRFEEGIDRGSSFPFAEVASEFHIIDNTTRPIIIPETDRAQELAEEIRADRLNKNILRSVQQYSVNVYDAHFNSLYDAGCIEILNGEFAVLIDEKKYNQNTGLDVSADVGIGFFA